MNDTKAKALEAALKMMGGSWSDADHLIHEARKIEAYLMGRDTAPAISGSGTINNIPPGVTTWTVGASSPGALSGTAN